MSEFIWPATVLLVALILVFARSRPGLDGQQMTELIRIVRERFEAQFKALEQQKGEQTPKAIVDRLNLIAKDLNETIKPRILAVEEVAQEAKRLADRHQSAATSKAIAGIKTPT